MNKTGVLPAVLLLLLVVTYADSVDIAPYQTNVTMGSVLTTTPIYVSNYDDSGNNLVSGANNYLTFWTRNSSTLYWGNSYNVTGIPNTIKDAKYRDDASWVAAIDDTTNNLFLFNKTAPATTFALSQTIATGSHPNTINWVRNGGLLLVGLNNGNVQTYVLNTTIQQWYLSQTIATLHTGGVAKLSGKASRFASCGVADNNVQIWYYNITTGYYNTTANQTIVNALTAPCTAIHMASTELKIAFGQSNGTVSIYNRDPSFVYGLFKTNTSAQTASVNFVRFTSDGSYLLTAGAAPDSTTKLWTMADSFTTPISHTIQGVSVDWDNTYKEFAIGTLGNVNGLNDIERLTASCVLPNTVNSSDTSRCTCGTSPQIWYNGACASVSCSASNSLGSVSSTNSSECACPTGWTWSNTNQFCMITCTSVANSTGVRYEYDSCYCNTGYNWDHSAMVCSSYQNCIGMANSNGTNVNSTACFCNDGYIWNTTRGACVKNCGAVNNAPTLSTTDNVTCICPSGWIYTSTWSGIDQGVCRINCSQYPRVSDYSSINYTSCVCTPGYVWTSGNTSCTLNCSAMSYTKGKNHNSTSCECAWGLHWEYIIGQCVPNKSFKPAAIAIGCGVGIPLGLLLLGALAYFLIPWGARAPPTMMPMPVMQPPHVVPIAKTPQSMTTTTIIQKPQAPISRQIIGAPPPSIITPQSLAPGGISQFGVGVPRYY